MDNLRYRAWLKNERTFYDVDMIDFEGKRVVVRHKQSKLVDVVHRDEVILMAGVEINNTWVFDGDIIRLGCNDDDRVVEVVGLFNLLVLKEIYNNVDVQVIDNIFEKVKE